MSDTFTGKKNMGSVAFRKNIEIAAGILLNAGAGLTRCEIAEKMQISEMTAGKIAKFLLSTGYFEERKRRLAAGRSAGEIFLRGDYRYIVVDLGDIKSSFVVFSESKRVITKHTSLHNNSLSYKDNVKMLSMHIDKFFATCPKSQIIGCGVIHNPGGEIMPDDITNLYQKPEVYINRQRKECIENLLLKKSGSGFSLYLYISDKIYAYVCGGGNIIRSLLNDGAVPDKVIKSEKDLFGYLLEFLCEIFNIIIPDNIYFESDKYIINENTIENLSSGITKKTGMRRKTIPGFQNFKTPSFAEHSMLCDLISASALKLSQISENMAKLF